MAWYLPGVIKRDLQGGTDEYKDYIAERNNWVNTQLQQQGISDPKFYSSSDGNSGFEMTEAEYQKVADAGEWGGDAVWKQLQAAYAAKHQQYVTAQQQLSAQWVDTLPPEKQTQVLQEFQFHSDDLATINKYGSMASKAIIGGVAGGIVAPLLSGGALATGGAAAVPAEALAAGTASSGSGLIGAAAGTGAAGAAGADTVASLMAEGYSKLAAESIINGTAGTAADTAVLGSNAATAGANAVNITAPALTSGATTGAVTGTAATLPFNLNSLPPPGAGPQQPVDPNKVEIKAPKDPSTVPPIIPEISDPHINVESPQEPELADPHTNMTPENSTFDDMIKYAKNMSLDQWLKAGTGTAAMYNMFKGMTTDSPAIPDFSKTAENDLLANRPNQQNAFGDTRQWTKNPDGSWSQKDTFGKTNQGLFDSASSLKGGLLEQAKNSKPLTTSGLPTLGGKVMDPVGNNQAITDAWMARMRPELNRMRSSENQRLANMGLTENRAGGANVAYDASQDRLNRNEVDATNQALIYGTDAYNKSFANSVQADSANRQNYQTEFDTNKAVANNPYFQINQMQGAIPGSPQFGPTGSASNTLDASQADYKAQMDQMNARLAQYEQNAKGMWDLYKTIGG